MNQSSSHGAFKQYFSINNLFVEKSDIDIFVAAITAGNAPKKDLFENGFPLYPGAEKKFVRFTGLQFVRKNISGNVCYANNNEDMRDEFKQVFEITDILYYVYGSLLSEGKEKLIKENTPVNEKKIPYPENSDEFWKMVKTGRDFVEEGV